jgi:hypothetical protein
MRAQRVDSVEMENAALFCFSNVSPGVQKSGIFSLKYSRKHRDA